MPRGTLFTGFKWLHFIVLVINLVLLIVLTSALASTTKRSDVVVIHSREYKYTDFLIASVVTFVGFINFIIGLIGDSITRSLTA